MIKYKGSTAQKSVTRINDLEELQERRDDTLKEIEAYKKQGNEGKVNFFKTDLNECDERERRIRRDIRHNKKANTNFN